MGLAEKFTSSGSNEQLWLASSIVTEGSKRFTKNNLNSFQHLPWRRVLYKRDQRRALQVYRGQWYQALVKGQPCITSFNFKAHLTGFHLPYLPGGVKNSDWSWVPFESRYIKQMAESDCLKICWRRCMKTMEDFWFLVQIWQGPLNMRCPGRNQILVHAVREQNLWVRAPKYFLCILPLQLSEILCWCSIPTLSWPLMSASPS